MTGNELTSLAAAVTADDLVVHADDVGRLLEDARAGVVNPLLLEIALDPTEAPVVRARAYGRILVEIERAPVRTELVVAA